MRSKLFLASCASWALLAGPAVAAKPKFGETTTIVVVEVPVQVVRDGEPVTGLTADDFEISDNGKKQAITGFEVVDLYGVSTGKVADAPPIAARRHFLFLFDLAFSSPDTIVRARDAAKQVLSQLHPTDVGAVATYGTTSGANFVLGFTSDRVQISLAIDTLGVPQLIEKNRDPLNLVLSSQVRRQPGTDGGKGIEEIAREELRGALERAKTIERADEQSRVSAFTGNLEMMATTLASIDGRKHVVLFSQGFADQVILGAGEDSIDTRRAAESGELWDPSLQGDARFGSSRSANQLQSMIASLQRADCVVQAVDISRLRSGNDIAPATSGTSGLFAMARDTGGELYENFNDLGEAMSAMLRRTGVTYLMSFQPQGLKLDGKAHRLSVKLKDGARGTRVLHRSGYYAPKPGGERTAVERTFGAAELVLERSDSGSIDLAVLAAPQPAGAPRWYVPVLVEIDGPTLLAGNADPIADLELFTYAFDAGGSVVDYFAQNAGLDLGQLGDALRQKGFKYWGHLDLPTGRYTVRVVARNARTGEHGARTLDLVVPDYTANAVSLLPPYFPEAPGSWVMSREGPNRQREVPYPFQAGGEAFIPAVHPKVPSRGATAIVLTGFHLPEPTFETQIIAADGTPATRAAVAIAGLEATDAGGVVARATLTTEGLDPGLYRLEVRTAGERTSTLFIVD